jgi:glycerol-3-phosphate acyltransferase PlsY
VEASIVIINLFLIAAAGYLLASFSISVQISRLISGLDIREYGSGNAGAANVLRIFGWKPALAVLVVDVGKGGGIAFLVPTLWFADVNCSPGFLQLVAGAAAVVGHCYPLFMGFRGGKGVATAAGALFVIYPFVACLCLVVFVSVLLVFRTVSVAALVASLLMPVVLLVLRYGFGYEVSPLNLYVAAGLSGFIVFTHRSNIARVWFGRERKCTASG